MVTKSASLLFARLLQSHLTLEDISNAQILRHEMNKQKVNKLPGKAFGSEANEIELQPTHMLVHMLCSQERRNYRLRKFQKAQPKLVLYALDILMPSRCWPARCGIAPGAD